MIAGKNHLYAHKNPPRPAPAADAEKSGPLCPMTRKKCLDKGCLFWDEDYGVCAMSPLSLYNQIRDAVTDAAVEVLKAYGDDLR